MEIRGSKVYVVYAMDEYDEYTKPLKVFADKKDAENFISWETYDNPVEWTDCKFRISEHFIE